MTTPQVTNCALLLVAYPDWNGRYPCKTVFEVFPDFEAAYSYTTSPSAKLRLEEFSNEMDANSVGWDYFEFVPENKEH